MTKLNRILALLVLTTTLFSCNNADKPQQDESEYVIRGEAQGTSYTIKYRGKGVSDYQQSVDSIFQVIDQSLSTYVEQSTISKFNRQNELVTNDAHFIRMVFESKDLRDISGGAFEPAVFPLVKAWGFGPDGPQLKGEVPVDSLIELVDWAFEVKISNQSDVANHHSTTLQLIKNKPVELDFNAIAKGYTVDVLFDFLVSKGAEHVLVEVGGEIRARGENAKGETWLVGVDQPDEFSERGSQALLRLDDQAVATSGSYRKFYEKDGKKYSHTIDPKTGYPVSHQLLSATVIASTCAHADAFATVFMVMGPEASMEFLNSAQGQMLEAYLIYGDESGNLKTFITPGLEAQLSEIHKESGV